MLKWGQLYQKVGDIRHHFDAVSHNMVSDMRSMRDPVDDPAVIDTLIEELEAELMELMAWKENL